MIDLFGTEALRMLGWKQPFASLMLHGKIETRTWNTTYRGKVLIYATKEIFTDDDLLYKYDLCSEELLNAIHSTLRNEPTKDYLGMAFATGQLVHTRRMKPTDEDRCFVKYDPKRYCHFYSDLVRIEPFEIKGTQSFPTLWDHRPEHKIIRDKIKPIAA
jgi:hypothetical protein